MSVAATLPLAFVMVAGPQIISAFFFATSEKWATVSAAYVLGAAASLLVVVTASYFVAKGLKSGGSSGGSKSKTMDYVIAGLLVLAIVVVFLRRKQSQPPKWMGKLETATPKFGLRLGFLLLGFFPTDILTSVAISAHLANHSDPWWHVLPFVALTLLLLGLPALLVLILGHRAERVLPKVRDWMNDNSWVVNEIVLAFFIVIVLG